MRTYDTADLSRSNLDPRLTRTLVPLKEMGESHLQALLAGANVEAICAGQTLRSPGDLDGQHVYLLHGDLCLIDEDGTQTQVSGANSLGPLAHTQPRVQTAIAQTDCSVLRVNSEQLDKLLTWSQVADYLQLVISEDRDLDEDAEWMARVVRSNLFHKVSPLNVEEIIAKLEPQVVEAGEVIVRQGEVGEHCFFIKEGEADVIRHTNNTREHLATIGVGRCFGEDALVNEVSRNATVVMRTNGVLMRLDKQDFYRLLKEPLVQTLPFAELAQALEQGKVMVDVRSEEEYSAMHLPKAVNLPLNLLAIKAKLLSRDDTYVFYCDTGRRSRAAAHLLASHGYKTLALADCPQLFTAPGKAWMTERRNFVLRSGEAQPGR